METQSTQPQPQASAPAQAPAPAPAVAPVSEPPVAETASAAAADTIGQAANSMFLAKEFNPAHLPNSLKNTEKVFVRNLRPLIGQYLRSVYGKFQEKYKYYKQFTDLRAFKAFLSEIPDWNSSRADEVAAEIVASDKHNFNFYGHLKYLLVGKVFLIVSARSFNGLDNTATLQMPVPTLNDFVYRVLLLAADELKNTPGLIRVQGDSYEVEVSRSIHLLNELLERAIRDALIDILPQNHIMDTYLADALKGGSYEIPTVTQTPGPMPVVEMEAPTAPATATATDDVLATDVELPEKATKLSDLVDIMAADKKKGDNDDGNDDDSSASDDSDSDSSGSDTSDDDVDVSSSSGSESESDDSSTSSSSDDEDAKKKQKKKKQHHVKKDKHHDKSKAKAKNVKFDLKRSAVRQVTVPKEDKDKL